MLTRINAKQILCALTLIASTFLSPAARADNGDLLNFRFRPLGLFVGRFTLDLDVAVGSAWTIGPEISYKHEKSSSNSAQFSDYDKTESSIGVRANWFKNGTYTSGLYLGPSLSVSHARIKTSSNSESKDYESSDNAPVLGLLVGYGWFWNSFNIMLGLGGTTSLGEKDVTISDSSGHNTSTSNSFTSIDGEFSLGWTF